MKPTIALLLLLSLWPTAAPAWADEWGCEVLLCAAADNPNWHGVESCHPPMERLMSEMKKPGFSWPTCKEGGAGKPGYDRYADCPAGWSPARAGQAGKPAHGSELSQCSQNIKICGAGRGKWTENGSETLASGVTRFYDEYSGCIVRETMARPLRDKPYYFDIHSEYDGTSERHYFDLHD